MNFMKVKMDAETYLILRELCEHIISLLEHEQFSDLNMRTLELARTDSGNWSVSLLRQGSPPLKLLLLLDPQSGTSSGDDAMRLLDYSPKHERPLHTPAS